MHLSENQLKVIPTSIGRLPSLRTLSLHGNRFDGTVQELVWSLIKESSYQMMGDELLDGGGKIPSLVSLLKLQGYLTDVSDLKRGRNGMMDVQESHPSTFFPPLVLQRLSTSTSSFSIPPPPTNEKRRRIVGEIIATEKTYVTELLACRDLYLTPLKRIFSPAHQSLLFSNLEDIINLHTTIILPSTRLSTRMLS